MKYKIGDKVRVKSIDWYNRNERKNGTVLIGPGFVEDMSKYCGKEYFIEKYFYNWYVLNGIDCWKFCDDFFEENKKLELE